MVKTKFKKAVSLMLATVMSLTAFMGIGATTAFAAVGEKADVYLVDYPRSGDTNNNGEWGHGNLKCTRRERRLYSLKWLAKVKCPTV